MENNLLMPFIGENDDPKFVRGFEAGQIWMMLKYNQELKNYMFHTQNTQQIEMICKRFLYEFSVEKIDEIWSVISAKRSESVN